MVLVFWVSDHILIFIVQDAAIPEFSRLRWIEIMKIHEMYLSK